MPTSVTEEEYDFSADAKEFWQGIRDGVDPSQLVAIQERMKEHCPSVDVFSFEVVDEPTGKIGSSPRTLEADTPKSCVDAWNSAKLVGLLSLDSDDVCGAAIGTVKAGAQDFKVCALSSSICEYGTHKNKSGARIPFVPGFSLRIIVPSSTGTVNQVFSQPSLSREDLIYLPPDSAGYERLLGCRFEPRVWKLLLEYFPGPSCLVSLKDPPRKPTPVKTDLPPSSSSLDPPKRLLPVSELPISSPTRLTSRQLDDVDEQDEMDPQVGWSDEEISFTDERPQPFGIRTAASLLPRYEGAPTQSVSAYPWESLFNAQGDDAASVAVSSVSDQLSTPSASKKVVRALLQRVKTLEAREKAKDASLAATFTSLSQTMRNLQVELTAAQVELNELKRRGLASARVNVAPANVNMDQLSRQVFSQIRKEAGLARVSDIPSVPDDLSTTLDSLTNELYHSAGVVPRLMLRVDVLEASRSSTSIEMGGHVFTDEAAVEAWLKSLNDPFVNRFCVDFLSLFLLAEPKYETIQQGLDRAAAVKKADFHSLDLATIDLSYKMIYPPRILKSSDKEAAQENGGVEWATGMATHLAFDGVYNNGTHNNLEKSIKGVLRAWESGIDVSFPVRVHPKPNAVFKAILHISGQQCLEYLNSLTPMFKQISGGISDKEAWSRGLVFTKQVFDDVAKVRAINSEGTIGSKVWASFRTLEMLKSYQLHEWVEHPKASSILALTSIRKEGKIVSDTVAKLRDQASAVVKHTGEIKALKEDIKALKKNNPSLA